MPIANTMLKLSFPHVALPLCPGLTGRAIKPLLPSFSSEWAGLLAKPLTPGIGPLRDPLADLRPTLAQLAQAAQNAVRLPGLSSLARGDGR